MLCECCGSPDIKSLEQLGSSEPYAYECIFCDFVRAPGEQLEGDLWIWCEKRDTLEDILPRVKGVYPKFGNIEVQEGEARPVARPHFRIEFPWEDREEYVTKVLAIAFEVYSKRGVQVDFHLKYPNRWDIPTDTRNAESKAVDFLLRRGNYSKKLR